MPSRRAPAAARRTRFDCTAPVTSTVSAPRACASPKWNSSWRTLFPPKASPVQSSRLIHQLDAERRAESGRRIERRRCVAEPGSRKPVDAGKWSTHRHSG